MDHNVEIVLCEGKNDEVFLSRILAKKPSIHDYSGKDKVLRRIYDHRYEDVVFIIREDGKQRLEKNLRLLISKLRSINRSVGVLVLVDSNSDSTRSCKSRIRDDLRSYISDRRRFPKPPSLSFEDRDPFYCIVRVTYAHASRGSVVVHLFVVPRSLEYWVHESGLNTVGKLKQVGWFISLCRVLGSLGLISQDLDESLVLTE